VDTNGLVLTVRVHGAELHEDRDGGRQLLAEDSRPELSRMELVWAAGAYTAGLSEWVKLELGWRVEEVPHHRQRQLWRYGLAKLGEAARVQGPAPEEVGGGAHVRLVEPGSSSSEQGLRRASPRGS
jgi:hypothetical protein